MARWIGLAMVAVSVPLFLLIRDGFLKIKDSRLRSRVGLALFGIGFAGFCLALFGGAVPALVFLAAWLGIAFAYNR